MKLNGLLVAGLTVGLMLLLVVYGVVIELVIAYVTYIVSGFAWPAGFRWSYASYLSIVVVLLHYVALIVRAERKDR